MPSVNEPPYSLQPCKYMSKQACAYAGANVKNRLESQARLWSQSIWPVCELAISDFERKKMNAANLRLVQSQNKEIFLCFIVFCCCFWRFNGNGRWSNAFVEDLYKSYFNILSTDNHFQKLCMHNGSAFLLHFISSAHFFIFFYYFKVKSINSV